MPKCKGLGSISSTEKEFLGMSNSILNAQHLKLFNNSSICKGGYSSQERREHTIQLCKFLSLKKETLCNITDAFTRNDDRQLNYSKCKLVSSCDQNLYLENKRL